MEKLGVDQSEQEESDLEDESVEEDKEIEVEEKKESAKA